MKKLSIALLVLVTVIGFAGCKPIGKSDNASGSYMGQQL